MMADRLTAVSMIMLATFLALGIVAHVTVGSILQLMLIGVSDMLLFTAVGLCFAYVTMVLRFYMIPRAIRNIELARQGSGFLIIALGTDGKLRFIPARTDGHFAYPTVKPYSEKYVFVVDPEAVNEVHQGKGLRASLVFMKYPFTLPPKVLAAIKVFRELGFETIHDLFRAVKLVNKGGSTAVQQEISELKKTKEFIENASDKELVEHGLDPDKRSLYIAQLEEEIQRLEKLAKMNLDELKGKLRPEIFGIPISAVDLINYLVWRHHPADLRKIITAEVAAAMEKAKETWLADWFKKWLPIIVVTGIIVMGIIIVAGMVLSGGHPQIPLNITKGLTP